MYNYFVYKGYNVAVVPICGFGYSYRMNASKPKYGTYLTPQGRKYELRTPFEVYEVWRALLAQMPTVIRAERGGVKRSVVLPESQRVAA